MKRIFLIVMGLVLVLSINLASSEKTDMEQAFEKAKELYMQGSYQEAIDILEAHFIDPVLYELNLGDDDPTVVKGRNLLGDCHRLTGRYDRSYSMFGMTLENDICIPYDLYRHSVSYFMLPFMRNWSLMPRIDLTEEEQSKYSIFHNLIVALDRFDRGEKPEAELLAKAMLNWENANKLGWVRVLLHWYCGLQVDLDELAEELSPDEKTRLYFYAGVKYEIDDRWEEAIKCYNKALSQKNVRVAEVDLVKFRMGSFYFDQKYYFYSESVPVLVEKVNGVLVKHHLANLFDKKPATAWVPINAQNALINIQLYVEYKVDGVEITNGYAKSESLFKKNSRAKTLRLVFSDGSEQHINLKDTMTPQYVAIGKNAKLLRFQVVDVYKGEQYQDLCISELRVDIKQSRRSD